MATDWPAGSVFAIFWLLLCVPVFLVAMIWFWMRRNIQPIKARSPLLVFITDAILLLYTISLCFQRIIHNDYPCLLNVWSGYIGTVILFNSYLWRCWTLYFNFNLTHVRLQSYELNHNNFFIKNRHLTSGSFLSKVAVAILFVLMIPPLVLTVTHPSIANQYGDGCEQAWGQTLLAVYVAAYVALFSWFSFSLRSVVDGFKIKSELKITGFIALLAVIPWFVFNQYASSLNTNTFPFSTMFILLAIVAAFSASTIYPLYASIFGQSNSTTSSSSSNKDSTESGSSISLGFMPLKGLSSGVAPGSSLSDTDPSQAFDRLYKILENPEGHEAFKQFLTKEFSVENIQFYSEIEVFRKDFREALQAQLPEAKLKFVMEARKIHAKYIKVGSAYQVNLPDPVVRNCEAHLKYEAHIHGASPDLGEVNTRSGRAASNARSGKAYQNNSSIANSSSQEDWSVPPPPQQPPMDHLDKTTATIFDDAQRTIYVLMEKDSLLRFVRSELYTNWIKKLREEEHKKKVLTEMNLV